MDLRPIVLLLGDAYRCDLALWERDRAIREADPSRERIVLFADETSPGSLDLDLQSSPLFFLGRHFVVRGLEKVRKPKPWAELVGRDVPSGTYVTFVAADLPAGHAVRKAAEAQDAVFSLPAPPARTAAGAVREVFARAGLDLPAASAAEVVSRTGGDLLAASREAEKLRAFTGGERLTAAAVNALVFSAAEPTAYPFYDRLGERDLAGALDALVELRDDPGRLLGGALRHIVRLAMLRVLLEAKAPSEDQSEAIGAPPWLVRRLVPQAKRFSTEELAAVLDLGVTLDAEIKTGGRRAPDALLALLLAATRRPSAAARG
ncbi:MAG: DNA polymerase III subunit delta [Candidatus Bipolaricaulota bacterium]